MKKKIKVFMMLLAFMVLAATPVKAYAKLKAPASVTTDAKAGAKYYKKHPVNYTPGPGIMVKWSKVKKADGYRVKIYWEGGDKYTTTTYVQKSGSKYKFTCKNKPISSKMSKNILKYSFISKKLQFVTEGGSDVEPVKVRVTAYQTKNGKKIYGKSKTVKVKN